MQSGSLSSLSLRAPDSIVLIAGRRRNSIGKRKRVSGGPVDQPRSRYSATQCS